MTAMLLSEFDYALPAELIAQQPLQDRAAARMLLLERSGRAMADRCFRELPSLLKGDELLVINNARVIPARLFAHRLGIRAESSGKNSRIRKEHLGSRIEVLLARHIELDLWEALVRPGRKVRLGERLRFEGSSLEAEVVGRGEYGLRHLRFDIPSAGNLCRDY